MAIYKEEMMRDYLLRKIARNNFRISGYLNNGEKSAKNVYSDGFNEILSFFARGLDTAVMKKIYRHMARTENKHYVPYNYFDLDTLISYDAYLESIFQEVDKITTDDSSSSKFHKGFNIAKNNWRETRHTPSVNNGYYNYDWPIGLMRSRENGCLQLSPKKALSEEQFEKQYDENECINSLGSYMEFKYNSIDVKNVVDQTQKKEIYLFKYNGKTLELEVVDKEYYVDIEGKALTRITAEGMQGRLYTTNYDNGSVYNGDLYDIEGNIVEFDGGGVEFYPNENFYASYIAKNAKKKDVINESFDLDDDEMLI